MEKALEGVSHDRAEALVPAELWNGIVRDLSSMRDEDIIVAELLLNSGVTPGQIALEAWEKVLNLLLFHQPNGWQRAAAASLEAIFQRSDTLSAETVTSCMQLANQLGFDVRLSALEAALTHLETQPVDLAHVDLAQLAMQLYAQALQDDPSQSSDPIPIVIRSNQDLLDLVVQIDSEIARYEAEPEGLADPPEVTRETTLYGRRLRRIEHRLTAWNKAVRDTIESQVADDSEK